MNRRFLPIILLLFCAMCVTNVPVAEAQLFSIGSPKGESSAEDDDFKLDEDDWDSYEEPVVINDPYEGFNRFMFKVNDKVYRYVFNPLSNVYDFVVPKVAQECVDNFFANAKTPVPFANNLFQKKYKQSLIVGGRFLVNSTVGIAGLFDPAESYLNWNKYDEDFGQTLGFYGMGSGPYIVLPLLGPSSGRDVLGWVGDYALSPWLWLGIYDVEKEDVFEGLGYLNRVNAYTYRQRDDYDTVMVGAIDPYIALQNFYVQIREAKSAE